jgi:hypothetical protein
MDRKTIEKICFIIAVVLIGIISLARLIHLPDALGYLLLILFVIIIGIPLVQRWRIVQKGGQEAEEIKKEMKAQQRKTTWVSFALPALFGLITVSTIIIGLNASFARMNEFVQKNNLSEAPFKITGQAAFIQKVIAIDIGVALIIIGGFWLASILFEKTKKRAGETPFDPFEETKKNKKIPGCILLVGLIIAVISFVFL